MNAQQYQMMQVLQKIPVFKGLDVKEALLLLKICRSAAYKSGQVIYTIGEPSTEMLILLKGRLKVTGRSGEVLATLEAGAATGEMGIFTGQPRSASIVAAEGSAGLIIRKSELMVLLGNNKDLHLRLIYNIVALLSARLAGANRLNDALKHKLESMGGEPEAEEEAAPAAEEEEEPEEEEPEEEVPEEEDDAEVDHLSYEDEDEDKDGK
ncbi:MAG: cyclic nucleotide-binding domain-containing protein [Candidatus Latescibacterota bacterium]|jgi:CRP-like cAMP-binding protein